MGLPLRKPPERFTYADYAAWPDEQRYELIDGVAYAMTAPGRRHQALLFAMARQIADCLEDTPCRVYLAPFDVRLPKGEEADEQIDTVVQPDLSVFCDRSKLDEQGARGAPDWVIEVLSPATAGHDHIVKRQVYERAGVREYWLVHPLDRIVTVYRLADGQYGRPDVYELAGITASRLLPQVHIDWERVLRELD
ncbi:MAG: Uma2 family endonuclease [Thiobacillaceae bacterium]|nr:Uma2 family endonuclease [Thiobacillaceae bacterium]